MAPITQILLFISYFILGVAATVILPRALGISMSHAGYIGMFIFFGAWQIQNWLVVSRSEKNAKHRLDSLEDTVKILRRDLERARREMVSRSRMGEEQNELVVSELKVLQTLLSQVTAQERGFKPVEVVEDTVEPTEEEVLELSVDHLPPMKEEDEEEIVEQVEEETPEVITEEEIEELELTPEEAALAVIDDGTLDQKSDDEERKSVAEPRAAVGPRRAPIRLIKREDQLLKVVKESLSENRIDLYLQPLVSLPSRKKVHYECFSRVRDEDGRIVLPRQYMKVAESKGLIGTIDNLLLFRLIQLVRRMGKRKPELRFFCNMSRHSMEDDEFFPQFIDFMTSNEEFSGRLVFEIAQQDFKMLDGDVLDRLKILGQRGFGFSLDMVTEFDDSFTELEKYNFQFIKADLTALMETHPERGDVDAFKSSLRRRGMQLVASRVETEDMVLQALEAQIEFAQGYLFGEPASAHELSREL
ncbi:EAL domain-containing protein [Kordiimonas laminariae]|uniref:EAL domain-containing protein n=1 Tax=Kordiimonas laminariae TaxID=2917717 RepID=UPI001FF2A02C|nr:EAL domain-containing protein [Kordiimonas laminariae]MCK0069102.1 EAL domain-containing protein [Kordiimonas laminariae]